MKKLIKFLIIFAISAGAVCLLWKPICMVFSAIYNFIQTHALFTSNLFNFVLVIGFFVWLLFYFIDIVGIMDKKSKETAKSISDAENKKIEAQIQLEAAKKSMKNVDIEVKGIISAGKNIAKNIEDNYKTKLDDELTSLKNRENLLHAAQIGKAQNEVSIVIANAAVAVSKEYIKNSLDEDTHKELIYNFIEDLDEGLKL